MVIEPKRLQEYMEAVRAREGENGPGEKGALWALLLMGISAPASDPLLQALWQMSMTALVADILKAYHPNGEATEFNKNHIAPARRMLRDDMKDGISTLGGR